MIKTNAMRLLDQAQVPYRTTQYEVDERDLSGVHAAQLLGVEPECVFKTLVARDEKNGLHVFCIPVAEELDLKKCAVVSGCRRIEMIHVKELPGLTGYIRGGCSPIGMKKKFPTVLDETCVLFEEIYVSAGLRGEQIVIAPELLLDFLGAELADLVRM